MSCKCTKLKKKCDHCNELHKKIKEKTVEYSHNWFYHKPCGAYLVNSAGGYFECDECGDQFFFTKLGLTAEDMKQWYEYWNKPRNWNHEHDKEMIEFFKECDAGLVNT